MRLLIITHTFPPSRHSNAKRPYYIAKGALEAGWEVDVVTSMIGVDPGQDESISVAGLRVFRCDDPVQRWQRLLRGHPALIKLLAVLSNGGLWPDYCAPWARRAFRRLPTGGYDRVLAFVYPPSTLLAGNVPGLVDQRWVFDYQESVSPQFKMQPRNSPLQRFLTPRLARLERRTLHQAGRVVFTADSNRRAYVAAGLVEEGLTGHVPYFYDDVVFREAGVVESGFDICYYGGFDLHGDRNPVAFLRSLARFLEVHPEARAETRFVFHGNWLAAHDRYVTELGLGDIVRLKAAVPYEDYLVGVRRSPVLLLVVAAAHNLFMPSKIVDYFGAKRPILAFVPRESEMRRVLEAAGMASCACDERDVAGGAEALGRLWADYRSGRLDVRGDNTSQWSSEVQIHRYLAILEAAGDRQSPMTGAS